MGASIPVKQVKITCKKKSIANGIIENIDRFNRKKLNTVIAKYIFYVRVLDSANFETQEEADAWKAEHPDVVGANVKTCIESAVNDCADAYIYMPDFEGENTYDMIYSCPLRVTNGTNYALRTDYMASLVVEDGVVKFESV